MQRFFDIVLSGVALIILLPVLLILIIVLRMTGEGEVFFSQTRVGKDGRPFKLLKFATMLRDSPNMGDGTVTVKDDPRVLPIGKFLRETKINELPQLINIFKGDMSVIGPRPQTERCFNAFPLKSKNKITRVRPGLSGVGSIFFRNEEKLLDTDDSSRIYDTVIMPYKGEIEEWFVDNQSFTLYVWLIIGTCLVMFGVNTSIIFRHFHNFPPVSEELKKRIAEL